MKKIALYCRVSSALQEKEATVESQLSELRDIWGRQVVKEYIDNGWSGELIERPAIDKLRNDAEKNLFDAVAVYAVDRIARKASYQAIILEELQKNGVEILIKDKPINDNPEGKFLFQILGAVAELEKDKILERTRRGRIHKVKTKKFLGYMAPYGYDYTKKTGDRDGFFSINRKEAGVVNLIFDLYIKYQSMTRVQQELMKTDIKPRKAKLWCRSVVSRILGDEAYTGTGFYNKRQGIVKENGKKYQKKVKNSMRMRPKSEWLEVKFPKIIDKDKFELAKQIRQKRFKPFGKSKHFYLLSGLIRCSMCSSTYTGSYNGGNIYYRCTDRRKRFPGPRICEARHMRADILDPAVWSAILKAVTTPEILASHVLCLANKINNSGNDLEKERKELLKEKNNLSFKKKKLDELFYKNLKNIDEYGKELGQFKQEENDIDAKLKEIDKKLGQKVDKAAAMHGIKHFCDLAKQRAEKLTDGQKQQFVRHLVDEIMLDANKKEAKIIGYIPQQTKSFDELVVETPFLRQSRALSTSWKHFASLLNQGKLPFKDQVGALFIQLNFS